MFVVKYRTGDQFIAGFNRQHEVVQLASDVNTAKTFKSIAAAQKWIAKYADCGYGLSSEHVMIVRP